MKCQRCPKQATTHITEILGEDRYEEVHLCEDCRKRYLSETGPKPKAAAEQAEPADAAEPAVAGPACPNCGLTYTEFRNQGRFGCAHDYDAFKAELLPLLEGIHGDVRHVGKAPRRLPKMQGAQVELAALRRELQRLVGEEKYEEAARVRDRIRQLEQD